MTPGFLDHFGHFFIEVQHSSLQLQSEFTSKIRKPSERHRDVVRIVMFPYLYHTCMVYLPTFTIQKCRYIYQSHGSYGLWFVFVFMFGRLLFWLKKVRFFSQHPTTFAMFSTPTTNISCSHCCFLGARKVEPMQKITNTIRNSENIPWFSLVNSNEFT